MPDSERVMSWARITRRQLDNWVDKGYLVPGRRPGQGFGGVQYDWSVEEARVAERMGQLTRAGIAPAMAAQFARGDAQALGAVLKALARCVTELRWRLDPPEVGRGATGVASEPEPCG